MEQRVDKRFAGMVVGNSAHVGGNHPNPREGAFSVPCAGYICGQRRGSPLIGGKYPLRGGWREGREMPLLGMEPLFLRRVRHFQASHHPLNGSA